MAKKKQPNKPKVVIPITVEDGNNEVDVIKSKADKYKGTPLGDYYEARLKDLK